jgi:hypothetical protein
VSFEGLAMSSSSRLPTAILGIALSIALLALTVPRTMAAFLALPGDYVLSRIQDGRAVTPAQLDTLAASRKRALEWVASALLYTDLRLAELMLAKMGDRDPAMLG